MTREQLDQRLREIQRELDAETGGKWTPVEYRARLEAEGLMEAIARLHHHPPVAPATDNWGGLRS